MTQESRTTCSSHDLDLAQLRRDAASGDAEAQYSLASCYADGHGVQKDEVKAFQWFSKASELGLPDATYSLAICHAEGRGVPKDEAKAFQWYLEAAGCGYEEGQYMAGVACSCGIGTPRNEQDAIGWYEKAALQGHEDAKLHLMAHQGDAESEVDLGWRYANGFGVPIRQEDAAYWLHLAIDQRKPGWQTADEYLRALEGDAASQHQVARDLAGAVEFGFSTYTKGLERAMHWLRLSADQGYGPAQLDLAKRYETGDGVPMDTDEAFKWFHIAANSGDPNAQFTLGLRYEEGDGVTKSLTDAAKWYRLAAKQGHADSQFCFGMCLFGGRGIRKNRREAVRWYLQAASQSNPRAQTALSDCYIHGEGVNKDEKEAVRWLMLAVRSPADIDQNEIYKNMPQAEFRAAVVDQVCRKMEEPYPEAEFRLGICFHMGIGLSRNEQEAINWLTRAAQQGHIDAQLYLGNMYKEGINGQPESHQAAKWFFEAAKAGNADAQFLLANMLLDRDYQLDGEFFPDAFSNNTAEVKIEEKALQWLRLAAAQGHENAEAVLLEHQLQERRSVRQSSRTNREAFDVKRHFNVLAKRWLNFPQKGGVGSILTGLNQDAIEACGRIEIPDNVSLVGLKVSNDAESLAFLEDCDPHQILTDLQIRWCDRITDSDLVHLQYLPGLKEISLSCRQFTDAGLFHLKDLTGLIRVYLSYMPITDAGLFYLRKLTRLRRLSLAGCKRVTGEGLSHLKHLNGLTWLDLSDCHQSIGSGLVHLRSLKDLAILSFYGTQITDSDLAPLKYLTGLKELDLRACEKITDAGIAHIERLTGLASLRLHGCNQITDAGLAHLNHLKLNVKR